MTSNGCTTRVETTPAVKPAVDSTSEGVRVTVGCLTSSGGYTRGITAAGAEGEIVAVVS